MPQNDHWFQLMQILFLHFIFVVGDHLFSWIRSVWVYEKELCFLQEKKKKKYTCDKLCYQETTHHYPWAWGSVSRNESNRKSTVGERNGRAWPVERDRAGGWMLERLAKLWLKAIVKTVERKWLRFQTSLEERKKERGREKRVSPSLL